MECSLFKLLCKNYDVRNVDKFLKSRVLLSNDRYSIRVITTGNYTPQDKNKYATFEAIIESNPDFFEELEVGEHSLFKMSNEWTAIKFNYEFG